MVALGLTFHAISHWHIVYVSVGILLMVVALALKRKYTLSPVALSTSLGLLVVLMLVSPGDTSSKLYAAGLFVTYLASKNASLKLLSVIAVVGTIGLIVVHNRTGGLFLNRNIAVGALILIPLLLTNWKVLSAALVGLYFTGAEQALVGIAAIGSVVLLRRDFGRKTVMVVLPLLLTIAICTPLGLTETLWDSVPKRFEYLERGEYDKALTGRADSIVNSTKDIRILGHGYEPLNLLPESVHNVPLRIVYEVGPIAALLWLALIIYGVRRRPYVFAGIIALSVFDHFMWTTLSPFCWTAWALDKNEPLLFKGGVPECVGLLRK